MFTVSKVLCPFDFSPEGGRALEAAVDLAAAHSAQLYLLYVVEGVALPDDTVADTSRIEASREAVRDRLAAAVHEVAPDLKPHLLVSEGNPAEEVLRMEEVFGIDLIVLAPHGRPTLGKIIFGSVADKVTRGSRAHLLIVKSPPEAEAALLEAL